MKTVYFLLEGQFGNNLFQYFAAEIIKKIYGYDDVKPTFQINLEFNTIINDEKFKRIMNARLEGHTYDIDTSKDILMMGFFQRSEIFLLERDYVRSLFNENNTSNISNRIKISNIVKYKTNHNIHPTENDLVLHVHFDINMEKKTSQMYDPQDIKNIITNITYDKLYIVCNTPKEEWDKEWYKEYISHFDELHPILLSGLLGDDFDFLLKAKKIITSASTMSWMAALLGNADEIHIPYNTYYGGYESNNQSLAECNNNSKVYYNISTWFPTQNPVNL
jgi:hypothetical protein